MRMRSLCLVALSTTLLLCPAAQSEVIVFSQGFETDTSGWIDNDDSPGFGNVERVASGTNGITSAGGNWHGQFTQVAGSGPFTRFGGYRSTWPGGFQARVDIYLDTNWAPGQGFDYSVAATGTDGGHQRDFIFHVTQDISTGDLLVGGSNNTNFSPRQDLENINHEVITASGWYTFEHLFRDDNGVLAVDLNLYNALGNLLFTETRTNAADLIPSEVGGNRYGWFTHITVDAGIAVDNATLAVAAEPTSLIILGVAGLGTFGYRRLRRAKRPCDQ